MYNVQKKSSKNVKYYHFKINPYLALLLAFNFVIFHNKNGNAVLI
jgi:hypothetical protein